APSDLEYGVLTGGVQQLVHRAGVDPAGRHGHDPGQRGPVLLEVEPELGVGCAVVRAADLVVAAHRVGVAVELADHGPGVDVVDAEHATPLRQHAEGHAV